MNLCRAAAPRRTDGAPSGSARGPAGAGRLPADAPPRGERAHRPDPPNLAPVSGRPARCPTLPPPAIRVRQPASLARASASFRPDGPDGPSVGLRPRASAVCVPAGYSAGRAGPGPPSCSEAVRRECAQILEGMKKFADAAALYEAGDAPDRAVALHIRVRDAKAAAALLPRALSRGDRAGECPRTEAFRRRIEAVVRRRVEAIVSRPRVLTRASKGPQGPSAENRARGGRTGHSQRAKGLHGYLLLRTRRLLIY